MGINLSTCVPVPSEYLSTCTYYLYFNSNKSINSKISMILKEYTCFEKLGNTYYVT